MSVTVLGLSTHNAVTFDSLILVNPYKAAGSEVIFYELVHVAQ